MTAAVDVTSPTGTDSAEAQASQRGILASVVRTPRGVVAIAFLVFVTLACLLAPWIARYDPIAQNFAAFKQGPSGAHWLGTDTLGRDVYSRLLYGGLISLLGVVEAVATRLLLGIPMGIAAGYLGGAWDRAITRTGDVVMSIPVIVILLSVLTLFNRNLTVAMITFGVMGSFGLMRVVRGSALATREELYIAAARVMGLSKLQIMARHILPRCRGVIIVQTSLFAAISLGVQTGLTYLGLGPPPPAPTWGGMVGEAASVVESFPWLLVPSGGLIALTVLAFGILGDVVRDATAAQSSAHGGLRAKPAARPPATTPMPAPSTLLQVSHLSVAFETTGGLSTVVDDVSFSVSPGETVGLVGESGSGKTVTARAILGLLSSNGTITGGEAFFGGVDLTRLGPGDFTGIRGSRIAMIAQEPMLSLDPTFRVGAQIAEIVKKHERVGRKALEQRVIELLTTVQIPDPADVARRYPHQISGGMAQRVVIAMALAGRPELLIADEPTTALDVTVQAEVLDLLRTIQHDTGMAILLVTHNWGVVADVCSRVVVMYAGQVVEQAPIASLFRQPAHPYTAALLQSSPERSRGQKRMLAIPGSVPAPHAWPVGCHFQARCPFAQADCAAAPVPVFQQSERESVRCLHTDQLRASSLGHIPPDPAKERVAP